MKLLVLLSVLPKSSAASIGSNKPVSVGHPFCLPHFCIRNLVQPMHIDARRRVTYVVFTAEDVCEFWLARDFRICGGGLALLAAFFLFDVASPWVLVCLRRLKISSARSRL
ncbi:hypothetical protein LZ32DRAFT_269684 [Colletotrichum eremochloae]|nr:hypothetical protein LZ32DRAFT_269684 [Colletotrichum eremochloae]